MGQVYEQIGTRLRTFIEQQQVFFVATAPLAGDGHVNISPKGRSGSLTVLDPLTVAYLDFGGSHAETVAHLRENGRITLMWCAVTGPHPAKVAPRPGAPQGPAHPRPGGAGLPRRPALGRSHRPLRRRRRPRRP